MTKRVALSLGLYVAALGSVPATAKALQGTQSPPSPSRSAQSIAGSVVETASGRPLANAQVTIVGSRFGTVTNAAGRYTLTGVTPGSLTVRVAAIGHAPQSKTVVLAAEQNVTVDFVLEAAVVQLETIVSVGYGTQRRQDLTAAVASVSGDQMKDAPIASLANSLEGKAPGIQVLTNSGAPGGGASVRIRGTNSITASSEPLYVIDGVPFSQGSTAQGALSGLGATTGIGTNDGTLNPLASIDPSDIESVDVLKDAAATAIYGTRGANGVVLITTKRGDRGSRTVQYDGSFGSQKASKTVPVMNTQQFITLANLANQNAGIAPRYTQRDLDTLQSFDWVGMILRTGAQQNHTVTISGGDARTRFLLSGNYLGQKGIIVNTAYDRYGARLNLDQEINSRFRVGTTLNGTYGVQTIGFAEDASLNGGVYGAMLMAPYMPPKDPNGNWYKTALNFGVINNPLAAQLDIQWPRRDTRILGNVFGDYSVTPDLVLHVSGGTNLGFNLTPYFAPSTVVQGGAGGDAVRYTSQGRELLSENTLDYKHELFGGTLDALAGASAQTSHFEDQQARAQGLPSNLLGFNNLGAGSLVLAPSSNVIDWTLLSGFGRLSYNLLDRYLFSTTLRRDGSSRFGANNKWATFPAGAFAWRLSNEPFLRDKLPVSDLKLRLGYGRTGNQAVAEYASLARLNPVNASLGSNPGVVVALAPTAAAPNPNLKWETQDQFSAGLDFGLLDDRVTLTADMYTTKTKDLLLNVSLPNTTGYTTQLQNVGSLRNRGWELGVDATLLKRGSFTWRAGGNVSHNKNEVMSLGATPQLIVGAGVASGAAFLVKPGLPLGSIYGYKVVGLWQQGDTCPLIAKQECTPGELKFQDTDGNNAVNDADRVVLGKVDPKFYGGFSSGLSLGRLTLDGAFTFSKGNSVLNLTRQRDGLLRGDENERAANLNYWTPTNTNTDIPRPNASRPQGRLYSFLVEDGSFVRLSTATLGHQLPDALLKRTPGGLHAARLYLTGQNLITWTSYTGFDPEVNRYGTNALTRGLDQSSYPRARIWNFGINVTF